EVIRFLEGESVNWIDMHNPQLLGLSKLHASQLLSILYRSLTIPKLSLLLKAMAFKHQVWHSAYLNVFREHRVRLLVQHQDRAWTHALQTSAIEKAGGILLGYHWSNLP